MAGKDANEKSLFNRIKDCVLTELRRQPNEPQRSPCTSRSLWGWELDTDGIIDYAPWPKKESKHENLNEADEAKKADDNSERESGGADDPGNRAGGASASGDKQPIEGVGHENNGNKETDGHGDSGSLHKGDEKIHYNEKIDRNEEMTTGHVDSEKLPGLHESCGSNRNKPIQYYIKMQNPEAPICCESLRSCKVCPPKNRRKQQETGDSQQMRATCQCAACLSSTSDSRENR